MYVQHLILISVCMLPLVLTAPGDDTGVYYNLSLRHYRSMIPEYGDVTSAQFWRMKAYNEPSVNHLMGPAFGDKFASFSIVGIKENPDEQGGILFDIIIRLKSPLDTGTDLFVKISDLMKTTLKNKMDDFKFKNVIEISNQQCTVDGVTHQNGDTFKTNTCIKCMCINGVTKCMNMNCSDVWIYENCTSETCRIKYAECTKGVCKCPRFKHPFFSIEANCTEGVDLGGDCSHHVQCEAKVYNSGCGLHTNVCECSMEYTRREGETKCMADLDKTCIFSSHCRQSNTQCQRKSAWESKCQCKDDFYEKDGQCHKKEPLGTDCTTMSHICAKNSECSDNKCQCINGTSAIGEYCYLEKKYGEVCQVDEDCRENNTHCFVPRKCVCKYGYDRNKENTSCAKKQKWRQTTRDDGSKSAEGPRMVIPLLVTILVSHMTIFS